MKKHIAAAAALFLLTVLVYSFSDYSSDKNMDADIGRQDISDVIDVDHIKVKANTQQLNDKSPSERDRIVESLGRSLTINVALRNKFDDIIHEHRIQQSVVTDLLAKLAAEMMLSQDANNQLVDLFKRYQQYLLAISELKKDAPAVAGIIDISESQLWLQQVYELQYELFIESEITAFFSKEKNYDQQALTRVAIRQDLSLSKAQKKTLIEHQISQLEPTEFAALKPTISANKIASLLNDSSTAHSSIDSELTDKQIERINTTQQKNRVWQEKIKAYKAQIAENKQLDKDNFLDEMKRYQQQHFTKNELKRLQVFLKNPQLLN